MALRDFVARELYLAPESVSARISESAAQANLLSTSALVGEIQGLRLSPLVHLRFVISSCTFLIDDTAYLPRVALRAGRYRSVIL